MTGWQYVHGYSTPFHLSGLWMQIVGERKVLRFWVEGWK